MTTAFLTLEHSRTQHYYFQADWSQISMHYLLSIEKIFQKGHFPVINNWKKDKFLLKSKIIQLLKLVIRTKDIFYTKICIEKYRAYTRQD